MQNEYFEKNGNVKKAIDEMSKQGDNQVFVTQYVSKEQADDLLKNNEITGYILEGSDKTRIYIKNSGINETIFKNVIDEIYETSDLIENISKEKVKELILNNPDKQFNINIQLIYSKVISNYNNQQIKINKINNNKMDIVMIEYYSLVAMACLYYSTFGLVTIDNILPNLSNKGKRITVSPVSKLSIVLSSFLASLFVALIGLSILFTFLIFALKVDFGSDLKAVLLLGLLGTLAGISTGMAIGILSKAREETKNGILISISMAGSMLSGMMGITMKYIVDKNIPILNKINPVNMITDGFYALYYYNGNSRFIFNIISLVIYTCIMLTITFVKLRREKYASL